MDQTAVECSKPPEWRDRARNDQRIAFVVRDPAPSNESTPAAGVPDESVHRSSEVAPEVDGAVNGEED